MAAPGPSREARRPPGAPGPSREDPGHGATGRPPAETEAETEAEAGVRPPVLLEVGRVARAHGLAGEVVVDLWTDRRERVARGATLWTAGGTRALRVVASRPHQGRHLVRFEGIADRSAAEALRGVPLEAPALDDPTTLWVHELVGDEVRTVDGRSLGVVTAVEANPASDLLVLEGGALVPLAFVVAHRPGDQITVDIPPGLLDL